MDRRVFKKFITKRSSIWTLSLCLTGALALGGIAFLDNSLRGNEELQIESEHAEAAGNTVEEIYPMGNGNGLVNGNLMQEGDTKLIDENAGDTSLIGESAEEIGLIDEAAGKAGLIDEAAGKAGLIDEAAGNASLIDEAAENAGLIDETTNTGLIDETAGDSGLINENRDENYVSESVSAGDFISEQRLLDAGIAFSEEDALLWPSAGTILIDYSMDSSVYFSTLNQYKYNPALIIGSEEGNQVLAAAKGIVESVDMDEETGTTLVLNIGNGYKLTYGQLKELAAAEGDIVEAGAVLGYVSEPTKYYVEEGSNLYFAMTYEDKAVDPVMYLE